MNKSEFELRFLEKQINRQSELEWINGDSSRALELGRRNFCLKGADLQAAKNGKNFVLFKDKKLEADDFEPV